MTRLSEYGVRQWRPGGSKSSRDKDPDIPIRVGELGLDTEAKKESRVLQLDCCDLDPNLLSRSKSEATVMSSQEIPGSQDPRR